VAFLFQAFSFHLPSARARGARSLQGLRLSQRHPAGPAADRQVLARHVPHQEDHPLAEDHRLAESSQDDEVPAPVAVPYREAHAHLRLRPWAGECRISGAQVPSPDPEEDCLCHPADSRQACALAAGPVQLLAAKDGNSAVSDALPLLLRQVCLAADRAQTVLATDAPVVRQASYRAWLCLAQTATVKRLPLVLALQSRRVVGVQLALVCRVDLLPANQPPVV
jgi:hypothetical protein